MSTDRDTLISFGFEEARIDWALKATGRRGLQPAMDHILENEGKPVPADGGSSSTAPNASGGNGDGDEDEDMKLAISMSQGGGSEQDAKSIKCSECGKVFRNTAMAEFHAEKSGHDQFEESVEEIKPLTEEEKKQRLEELRQKMAEKRAKKSTAEAEEQKANEALRRKAGKDAGQIREDLKLKEALKEAELKKREKVEEAKARAAVKAQIEADKKARAEKAAAEKALREGRAVPSEASTSTPAAAPAPAVKKEYNEARLQIRLAAGGAPLVVTLPATNTLQDVAEYVASQALAYNVETITFATTFPRKVFTRTEWRQTLKELNLVPSATLMAS